MGSRPVEGSLGWGGKRASQGLGIPLVQAE